MGPETAKNARVICDTICSENIDMMHDVCQTVALINKNHGMYLSQICQCLKTKELYGKVVMIIHCCKIDKRNSSYLHFLQCSMRFTCNKNLNCMRLYLVHCGLVQHILARFMNGIFIVGMFTLLSCFVIMSWVNNLDVLFPSFILAPCLYYFRFLFLFLLLYKWLSYIFKPNEDSSNVTFSVTVPYNLVAGYATWTSRWRWRQYEPTKHW